MAAISDYEDDPAPPITEKKLSLVESFLKLSQSVGHGIINDVRMQCEVVSYIADECGYNLTKYIDSTYTAYPLDPILERACVKYLTMMSTTQTICRWFLFFIEHRVTMAARRREMFLNRRGSRRCRQNVTRGTRSNRKFFTPDDTDSLIWLIRYCH